MLVARSAPECRLYIDLNPCSCGEVAFDVRHALRTGPDGDLVAVYEGACGRCGLPRRFTFALAPFAAIARPITSASLHSRFVSSAILSPFVRERRMFLPPPRPVETARLDSARG